MIIAIDFDGTLHDVAQRRPGRRMGPPMPGAATAIRALRIAGHTLYVFTAQRAPYDHIWDWINYFGMRQCFVDITNIKLPTFELFIDNRALRYVPSNWAWEGVVDAIQDQVFI